MNRPQIRLRKITGIAFRSIVDAFGTETESARFNRVMGLAVGSLLAIDLIFSAFLRLGALQEAKVVAVNSLASPGMWLLVGVCYYCRWRGGGLMRMGDISQLAAWSLLVVPTITFLIPVAARSPYPLVDVGLRNIDALMHFQTVTFVRLIAGFPRVQHVLNIAYNLLLELIIGALLIPAISGKIADSRRFVLAVLVAAVFTSILFALWPAAGPWTVEGFAPTKDQATVVRSLEFLKSGQPPPDDVKDSPVVAFPSFHVVLAVLALIALWRVPWARWLGLMISVLICASTITTGWHYGIDVLGGLAVTFAAQWTACFMMPAAFRPAKGIVFTGKDLSDAGFSRM